MTRTSPRRRPVWAVVLTCLFVLPMAAPRGFEGLEGAVESLLSWPSRVAASRGSVAGADGGGGEPTARERRLEEMWLQQRVENCLLREKMNGLGGLALVLGQVPLDRLPVSLPARVVRAHDASPSRRSVTIDRGERDGVRPGYAVVQGGTLVGLVRTVRDGEARVQVLGDPGLRLELAIRTREGERTLGWLRPRGGDVLELGLVRTGEGRVVRAGDPVVTSNDDARVPADLPVGTVEEVSDPDGDGLATVRVHVDVDLVRSCSVVVLVPRP